MRELARHFCAPEKREKKMKHAHQRTHCVVSKKETSDQAFYGVIPSDEASAASFRHASHSPRELKKWDGNVRPLPRCLTHDKEDKTKEVLVSRSCSDDEETGCATRVNACCDHKWGRRQCEEIPYLLLLLLLTRAIHSRLERAGEVCEGTGNLNQQSGLEARESSSNAKKRIGVYLRSGVWTPYLRVATLDRTVSLTLFFLYGIALI